MQEQEKHYKMKQAGEYPNDVTICQLLAHFIIELLYHFVQKKKKIRNAHI
jgi:hypothetical protein